MMRGLALALNIPVPTEIRLLSDHAESRLRSTIRSLLDTCTGRRWRNFEIGGWSVADRQSLLAAVDRLKHQHGVRDIVVQELLAGCESQVGIIGNVESGPTVLPIMEVDFSALSSGPHIQCHDSEWDAS